MIRKLAAFAAVFTCLGVAPAGAAATGRHVVRHFGAGAPGIGDPYFPLDGNGGYDAKHYLLQLRYAPSTDVLTGVATMRAKATQNLSSFDLDLQGLNVRSVKVGGRSASWRRDGNELIVTPQRGLHDHQRFTTVVKYDGVPEIIGDAEIGISGFVARDDGTVVAGQPHGAATWYRVNDHPLDKAAYTFEITVPKGLEAIANGVLKHTRSSGASTTWRWDAKEPMASYLTTADIGEFDVHAYKRDGIRYWDAIDPDLMPRVAPRTGTQFAISQAANTSYKRLARTISVPAGGAQLSFWVNRDPETNWDFMFVEAHRAGPGDEWTTLPDLNGHTSQDTGFSC